MKGDSMGQPVIHFEVIGKDGEKLRSYYSELFGWEFGDVVGPTNYAVVPRDGNTNAEGLGIGGGIGTAPEGYDGHVTFYVEVPDVEAALAKAESLGGTRMMGPDKIPEVNIEIGLFTDPEGHVIGVVK
jgi:predicted enzyme related to lactoylglutathione lyase